MPWIPTIAPDRLEPDGVASAQAGKVWVALYRAEGEYYATSVVCSHGQASLADGYLEGYEIECPLHQGLFDIRTGAAVGAPCTEPVKSYPARLNENGLIEVQIDDAEAAQ